MGCLDVVDGGEVGWFGELRAWDRGYDDEHVL